MASREQSFDLIDIFIANHAINLAVAERAMATPSTDIARMIVDINVPRAAVLEIISGCTPAKLVDIINQMNVLEMMMGLAKMRARKHPGQPGSCHQPQGASGPAGRRRCRGCAARLCRGRNDHRRAALCCLQRPGHSGRLADRARRRADPVRRRGSGQPAPGLQGTDELLRDTVRLRHRAALLWMATIRPGPRLSWPLPMPAGASRPASPPAPAPRR